MERQYYLHRRIHSLINVSASTAQLTYLNFEPLLDLHICFFGSKPKIIPAMLAVLVSDI
jgi:hypothetical protein